MTDDQILTWLEADEAASRPYRVCRMRLLLDLFGQNKNMLFFGGAIPAQAFEEMRLAYLHGLYVSCVVISQVVIEHILGGLLNLFDRSDSGQPGLQKLTEEALANGHISQEEYDDLNELRRLRNPYSHSKPVMHRSSIMRRAASTGDHPQELFKQDAETALAVVARLLARRPFSFPDRENSGETNETERSAPTGGVT